MAVQWDESDGYKLKKIVLVGGKLYAGYEKDGKPYEAQVCHVLDDPYVLLTTTKREGWLAKFSTIIRHPFRRSHLVNNENFFVVEKIAEVDRVVIGKQRRLAGEPEVWLPILRNNQDEQILYVFCPDTGRFKLVILENDRPWSSLEKALVGTAAGLGIFAVAAAAAAAAVAAFPALVAAAGFGAGGIAVGSTAASMMSAGFIGVATLQSIGAAGMGIASTIIVGGVGAATGTAVGATAVAAASSKSTYKVDDMGVAAVFLMRDGSPETMDSVSEILGIYPGNANITPSGPENPQ